MAVVFEPTKGLTDKPFHYCPGCCHGIIHRLVAETLVANDALETAVGVASVGCTYNSYELYVHPTDATPTAVSRASFSTSVSATSLWMMPWQQPGQ